MTKKQQTTNVSAREAGCVYFLFFMLQKKNLQRAETKLNSS